VQGRTVTPAEQNSIISASALTKQYGDVRAVDNVSLEILRSEIFGILGPNGAGKTTTLEMIEGLRQPDSGTITVAGFDVATDPNRVKQRIGIQLQSTSLFEHLTVRELVALFAALYGANDSRERVTDLLGTVSLVEKAEEQAQLLSGGQQQRLSIALALVNDPDVVFLDEPTTGLDPQARRNLWDLIETIRGQGKTIVLTTHYMEEAELLCDRVAIMDQGRIIQCDTPANLVAKLGLSATITADVSGESLARSTLDEIPAVTDVQLDGSRLTIHTTNLPQTMSALMDSVRTAGSNLEQLSTSRPTLEDVFLHYTGRALRS
jgi:ABC-2 type transport system ATP-binding protein